MIKLGLFCRDKKAFASLVFLGVIILMSLIFPLIPSLDPTSFDPDLLQLPEPGAPGIAHIFGTDDLGRDLFLRCIFGARISLLVAFVSVIISLSIGVAFGLLSGYVGGVVDEVMMRLVDMLMAIPTLFLILIIQVQLDPSIWNVVIVIGVTSWMGVARLVRAEVLSVKERPFILAAKSRGLRPFRVLCVHVLPHTMTPVIVYAMLGMGGAILTEAVLSYLGLGVQPPQPSWGNMLEQAVHYMEMAPWMAIFPGVLITITVLSFNFIGDRVRELLNPKEKVA